MTTSAVAGFRQFHYYHNHGSGEPATERTQKEIQRMKLRKLFFAAFLMVALASLSSAPSVAEVPWPDCFPCDVW